MTRERPVEIRQLRAAAWLSSRSPEMSRVLAHAQALAAMDTTVLLSAETGSGKEVLARHIHATSPRSGQVFLAVNCGALPAHLVESELFGHERGAFTGAVERRIGYFEAAHGGTILLDEVSELPLGLQTRLLRVLQEREVQRLGATRPTPIDVRVIATTNRDLPEMVRRGEFRKDLFYRLNVFPLTLPPLRERLEDLPELVTTILEQLAGYGRFGRSRALVILGRSDRIDPADIAARQIPSIHSGAPEEADIIVTAGALELLRLHNFPGNVRELRNVLERALVLARDGIIDRPQIVLERAIDDTPLTLPLPHRATHHAADQHAAHRPAHHEVGPREAHAASDSVLLRDIQRTAILRALTECGGNRTHASLLLGISIRTLRNKLREYRDLGHLVPNPSSPEP